MNNNNDTFPPLMNDGRNYTNWYSSSCTYKNNFKERQFLIKHASDIMKQNLKNSMNDTGVSPLHNTDTPYSLEYAHIHRNIDEPPTHPYYGYQDSDMKRIYASKTLLDSRMSYPLNQQFITKNN